MSKKKHKKQNHSSQQSVPSSNRAHKVSSVSPSGWEHISEKAKEASRHVVETLQYTTFRFFTISRINTEVFDNILAEWRARFSGGFWNGTNERALIGALIIKECYSYSDKELIEKLASNYNIRDALTIGQYFDSKVFTEAYVNFCQIVFKHYKNTKKDIISESLLQIAPYGELNIRISHKEVVVDCSHILLHIIHKNIYRFMHNSFAKFYKNIRYSVDYNMRNEVDDYLQAHNDEVILASTPPQLLCRLEELGNLSYRILHRVKIKQRNDSQLQNYFDKYFEVVSKKIYLKHIFVANPFVFKQIGNILGALKVYSAKKINKVDEICSSQNDTTYPKISEDLTL